MPGPITRAQYPISQLSGTDFASEPAANTAAIITVAAPPAGFRLFIQAIEAYYDTAAGPATAAFLLIESPVGTNVCKIGLGVSVAQFVAVARAFVGGGFNGADGQVIKFTLPVGAAGAVGHLFVICGTEPTIA